MISAITPSEWVIHQAAVLARNQKYTEIWWACPDKICETTSKIYFCLLFLMLRKMYSSKDVRELTYREIEIIAFFSPFFFFKTKYTTFFEKKESRGSVAAAALKNAFSFSL